MKPRLPILLPPLCKGRWIFALAKRRRDWKIPLSFWDYGLQLRRNKAPPQRFPLRGKLACYAVPPSPQKALLFGDPFLPARNDVRWVIWLRNAAGGNKKSTDNLSVDSHKISWNHTKLSTWINEKNYRVIRCEKRTISLEKLNQNHRKRWIFDPIFVVLFKKRFMTKKLCICPKKSGMISSKLPFTIHKWMCYNDHA